MRVIADYPRLVAEWHLARNLPDTPASVDSHSYQPIWWKCPRKRSHIYQASAWERAYGGGGCPTCGDQPAEHAKRFAERFPELAQFWHPTKNRHVRIEDILATSSCRLWWKCPQGPDHEWSTTVDDCSRRKNGCPFCAGTRPSVTTSIATLAPELARQWHPTRNGELTPDRVTVHSGTSFWWQCPNGADHVWSAPVSYRVRKKVGCPMCSSHAAAPSESVAAVEPEFARYWHPTKNGSLKPRDVLPTSSRKVWWKCPEGVDHEWSCAIKVRMRSEHPCPFCNNRKLSVTNSLQARYPRVAAEWHPTKNAPVTAADVLPGAQRKYWWRCTFGHEWRISVYSRSAVGSGCPACAATIPANASPVVVPMRFETRVRSQHGTSTNHRPSPSKFVADFPHLVAQWVRDLNLPNTPESVGAGSDKMIWWKCPVGSDHLWQATPWRRAAAEQGCPYCSGRRVSYTNSLAKNFPAVAEQWHRTKNGSMTPDDVVATSCRLVWWRCPKAPDHVWRTKVEDRTRRGYGCPFCVGRRVCKDNSLARIAPKIAAWWHPTKNGSIMPDHVTVHSYTKRWWKCPEGGDHVWAASVAQRIRHPKCPMCRKFLPSKTTTLKAMAPEFARYWHPTKNGALKPSEVSSTSRERVWWKCPEGPDHEWQCTIVARIAAKNPCPYCAGRRLSVTNSLQATHPRVAWEWHPKKNAPLTPRDVLGGDHRKFWWKCVSGHEWAALLPNRTRLGSGCPICAHRTRGLHRREAKIRRSASARPAPTLKVRSAET